MNNYQWLTSGPVFDFGDRINMEKVMALAKAHERWHYLNCVRQWLGFCRTWGREGGKG